MSWIKENPFPTAVGVVTAVLGAGIVYFGMQQKSAYSENIDKFADLSADVSRFNRLDPYPTSANAKAKKESIEAFQADVDKLNELMTRYLPADLADVDPSAFITKVTEVANATQAMAESKALALPDDFALGFEALRASAPARDKTGELIYQLGAVEWLVNEVANAGGTAINNVKIDEIKTPGGNNPAVLPFEFVFTAPEAAVRQVLESLTSSEKYFVRVKLLRIQNTTLKAPEVGRVEFENIEIDEVADAPADDGGFDFGADEVEEVAAPEAAAAEGGQRILTQVLGAEQLTVGLVLELVLFTKAG